MIQKGIFTKYGIPFMLAVGCLLPDLLGAQTTFLDTTFGTGGIVTTGFGGNIDQAYAVALQHDGRIVVAGHSNIGTALTKDIALVRYNVDGTIDPTFGTLGIVTTNFGASYDDFTFAMAIQDDYKIVIAGASFNGMGYRFALARYNTDGTLDNAFGTAGLLATDFGGLDDWGRSIAIMDDGKILVGGYRNDGLKHNFALIRCNADGTLDNTFDTDGKVYTSFASDRHDQAYSMAVQSDGKIVLAGYSYIGTSSDYQIALARYNEDGSLDNTFDTDGKVLTDIAISEGEAYAVALQFDNKIVVAGYSFVGTGIDFLLARYNTDGSLDNTFGTAGIVNTDFTGGHEDNAYAMVIQGDGKIVVAGDTHGGYGWDFALARYNTDGTLDNSFGYGGKITTQVSIDADAANAMAIQADGKILLSGYRFSGVGSDFATARYDPEIVAIGTSTEETPEPIISVSPNPFSDVISIRSAAEGNLILSDMTGKTICSQHVLPGINLLHEEMLSQGFYMIQYSDGKTTQNIVVVKK